MYALPSIVSYCSLVTEVAHLIVQQGYHLESRCQSENQVLLWVQYTTGDFHMEPLVIVALLWCVHALNELGLPLELPSCCQGIGTCSGYGA